MSVGEMSALALFEPQTLRVIPAVAAGLTGKVWSMTDVVRLLGEV